MNRNALIILGAAALGLGLAAAASAGDTCECTRRSSDPVSDLPRFKAAFAGRVQAVEEKEGRRQVTFEVARAWKGGQGKAMTVSTGVDQCGVSFETGKDYVVFATGEKDALKTDACAPTSELGTAPYTVKQLDLHSGYGGNPLRMPSR